MSQVAYVQPFIQTVLMLNVCLQSSYFISFIFNVVLFMSKSYELVLEDQRLCSTEALEFMGFPFFPRL